MEAIWIIQDIIISVCCIFIVPWRTWRIWTNVDVPLPKAIGVMGVSWVVFCMLQGFAHLNWSYMPESMPMSVLALHTGTAVGAAFFAGLLMAAGDTLSKAINSLAVDRHLADVWDRVHDQSGVGRGIWFKDGSLWFDNVSRRNMGIPLVDDAVEESLDTRMTYAEWAEYPISKQEIERAQHDISEALASGGPSAQTIRYANGKTMLAVGTSRANGFAWAGWNIDITNMKSEREREITAAQQAEVDRLQQALRSVGREQQETLMLQSDARR